LYIPIISRIVGDAYTIEQRISFGPLLNSSSKEVTIDFTNNTQAWKDIKWSVNGSLSKGIIVSLDKSKCTDSRIVVTLSAKQSMLGNLPKGYLFSHVTFYQNELTDEEAVSILVDGYNE
jgi:hypothetical protein